MTTREERVALEREWALRKRVDELERELAQAYAALTRARVCCCTPKEGGA